MKHRTSLLAVVAILSACSKEEAPPADTAAASAMAATPAPATLASMAGNFDWVMMAEAGDSVMGKGTAHIDSTGAGWTVNAARNDTVRFTSVIQGDSIIQTSSPYTDPTMPKSVGQITFRYAGPTVTGTAVMGAVALSPAAKPDTVIARARVQVTKR